MSGQMSFGQVLRNARENKGIQVNEAARRLRIRPDIVRALEAGDFSCIPPKGYARNMVNAYARYLGLNATDVTRMYLDEAYAHQLGKQAGASRGTGFNMPASRTRAGFAREEARAKRQSRAAESRGDTRDPRGSRGGYGSYDARDARGSYDARGARSSYDPRGSRDAYGSSERDAYSRDSYTGGARGARNRNRNSRAALTGTPQAGRGGRSGYSSRYDEPSSFDSGRYQSRAMDRPSRGTNQLGREVYDGRPDVYQRGQGLRSNELIDAPRRSRRDIPNGVGGGMYSQPKRGGLASKLPLIAVIVVVLVVVAIVANMLLNRGSEQPSSNVSNLLITGISDTSGSANNENVSTPLNPVVTVAPTCSTLTYTVKSGQAAYIEVYLDNAETASIVDIKTGPVTENIDFSGKIRFVTANKDGVTLKVDGKEVELKDANGTGVFEFSADFATILADWQREHVSANNASSNANTINATGSSSSGGSNAASNANGSSNASSGSN